MASTSYTLSIRPRGKPIPRLPTTLIVASESPTSEIYAKLASQTKYSVHRLRVTKGSDGSVISTSSDSSISSTGLRNNSTIYIKDLGPQISWLTVFVIEYIGPLVIHAMTYYLRRYLFGKSAESPPSTTQTTLFALIMLHFLKREFETLFVHRFSLATMPVRNIFKNSAHYWIVAGLNIAFWVYRPAAVAAREPPNPLLLYLGLALYIVGELGNFSAHLTLKNLRSAGGKERGIPQGYFFNVVTCPNYMFEITAWLGMYLASRLNWSLVVMIILSTAQMATWGKKKERRYRKEFGDKYKKKRYAILPGIY